MKSVTILTLFPSGFTTKNAGEYHSVGSWHGVITFLFSSSFMHASAGALKRKGICLATNTRYGVAFGFRKRCTFSDSMGWESRVSRKTLGYLSRISSCVEDATEFTVCGKLLLMTFSLIRSCHDKSMGCARFVVTSASVLMIVDFVFRMI